MGLNSSPITWVSGNVVTAAQMNTEVRDVATGIQAAWTAWTPTVAAGLTVGNGTWTGSYLRIGKLVHARFSFTFGSSSSTTGALLLYPVAINTAYPTFTNSGSATLYDTSVGTLGRLPATVHVNSTASSGVGSFGFSTSGGTMTATIPFTWATGDQISGTLLYEAA